MDNALIRAYFSDYFGVLPETLEGYGAFNISLLNDLPLFIDPFLLFNSTKKEYQKLHDRIIHYLKFLREKSAGERIDRGLIHAWYRFPEVKQNWLGFSISGNEGRGLGSDFAGELHGNLHRVFSDFGDERVTKGSHLEKLCLFTDGVGRDNISDFTTNLIKEYLLEYTQTFARKFIHPSLRRETAILRVRFNYVTESWESDRYELPHYDGDYIILTPKDMLTKDQTWINRPDLIDDFDEIRTRFRTMNLERRLIITSRNSCQGKLPRKTGGKQSERPFMNSRK